MRCPACGADNPDDARQCGGCGKELRRRPRRRGVPDESNTPFTSQADSRDRLALAAYRYAVYGLVPFAGLALGPLAVVLGAVAWRRVQSDPDRKGVGPAATAMVLGALVMVTNWVGLALMVVGLTSS
jgi:hypothetical protein